MPNIAIRTFALSAILASSALAQDTVFKWSRALPTGARFSIRNYRGLIDVRPGTSDKVEVAATMQGDARIQAKKMTFDVRDHATDDVEICAVYSGLNVCDGEDLNGGYSEGRVPVRITVELPRGLRLRVINGSGPILVMQTVAGADVNTGSGDIVIRESESGVIATTGSGDVTIAAANGAVRAATGNGRVLVMALGPVDASSGNGTVEVQMASLPPTLETPSMSISSGNGKVKVTLPGDFNGQLDASSGNGDVKSDFGLSGVQRGDSRLRGAIGSGRGPLVKIHSGNGRVEIHKG